MTRIVLPAMLVSALLLGIGGGLTVALGKVRTATTPPATIERTCMRMCVDCPPFCAGPVYTPKP